MMTHPVPRDVDTFEFTPPAFDRVTGYLHHLTEAGQGWINLLPGVDADEDEQQTMPPGLFSLFSNRQPPVTMCTLMPARPSRRAIDGVTVGLLHPTGAQGGRAPGGGRGRRAAGWLLRQDHPRRGLVLLHPTAHPRSTIIEWALRAGTALCRQEMTGQWQAVVYLP